MLRPCLLAAAVAATIAPASAQHPPAPQKSPSPQELSRDSSTASAAFIDPAGQSIGKATLRPAEEGVLLEVEVSGLPANQWVAFHIHENGTCDPKTKFKSAGGHFNPSDQEHGFLADGGPHAGDMPNQYIPADGTLRAHVFNDYISLGDGDADVKGKAIIIHDGRDDYRSQPTGDAGGRLACAVIK